MQSPPPTQFTRLLPALIALAGLAMLPGCLSTGPYAMVDNTAYLGADGSILRGGLRILPTRVAAALRPEPDWHWDDSGTSGPPSIEIHLGEQIARFYKGGTQVGYAPICSGTESHPTPTGSFTIQQKNANHISNLYGDYVDADGNVVAANIGVNTDKRPPGTRFRGASMPHFMRITGGVGLHAGYLPGYPDSHGCIRLPDGAAAEFFAHAPVGTPVRVRP